MAMMTTDLELRKNELKCSSSLPGSTPAAEREVTVTPSRSARHFLPLAASSRFLLPAAAAAAALAGPDTPWPSFSFLAPNYFCRLLAFYLETSTLLYFGFDIVYWSCGWDDSLALTSLAIEWLGIRLPPTIHSERLPHHHPCPCLKNESSSLNESPLIGIKRMLQVVSAQFRSTPEVSLSWWKWLFFLLDTCWQSQVQLTQMIFSAVCSTRSLDVRKHPQRLTWQEKKREKPS